MADVVRANVPIGCISHLIQGGEKNFSSHNSVRKIGNDKEFVYLFGCSIFDAYGLR